jgi:ubiquinol-cytochrome c reductase iron-sulfur subunit
VSSSERPERTTTAPSAQPSAQDEADRRTPGHTPDGLRRRAERVIAVALVLSAMASIALVAVYFLGGQTQVEGMLLGVSLGGLGIALAYWGTYLLGAREVVEERHELSSGEAGTAELQQAFTEEVGPELRRRGFLVKLLGIAGGALGISLLPPIVSLGPAPGNTLTTTAWRAGTRLVRDDTGAPIRADELVVDQVLTVVPENAQHAADSVALLIKLPPDQVTLTGEKLAGTINGLVCYSKICTHAGCPVGLYRAVNRSLFCPCHQSQFDVLADSTPTFGPAARALPQLPIAADEDGFVYAQGDFFEPVGPAFWDRGEP